MCSGNIFLLIILVLWQLPQSIIGILLLVYVKAMRNIMKIEFSRKHFFIRSGFSVSLGLFIFYIPSVKIVGKTGIDYDINKEHEYGHGIQSQLLGPFYLLVIGLPSLLWATYILLRNMKTNHSRDLYYKAYTEKWADKLAKIERSGQKPKQNIQV